MRRLLPLLVVPVLLLAACGNDEVDTASPTPTTTGTPALAVTEVGTSFGMCAGFCSKTVTIDRGILSLLAVQRIEEEAEVTNTGTLTEAGVAALTDAVADVDPAALEEIYGCPDCADGGAAFVAFATGERSTYDFGGPPEELAAVDDVAAQLIDVLSTCVSDDFVIVDEGCTPLS